MRAQHRPQKSFTVSLKNEYQYIKILCKSIINNKNNQQNMFVNLLTLGFGHFVTLISETHNQVLQLPGRKNGRKLVRAFTAESIYCCMLLFLDHILCCRAHLELCSL